MSRANAQIEQLRSPESQGASGALFSKHARLIAYRAREVDNDPLAGPDGDGTGLVVGLLVVTPSSTNFINVFKPGLKWR